MVEELKKADGSKFAFIFTSGDKAFIVLPNIRDHLRLL